MKHKKLISAACILSVGVIWFVGVDWSWFVHDCPDCGHGKDVAQYRFFTLPLLETDYEFPSVAQQVATDLGLPCQHPNMQSWHKHRWWGLVYCKSPCINGIYRLTGSETWYDNKASAKIIALAESDQSLKTEYASRVFVDHDAHFLRDVLDRAGVQHPILQRRITK